MTGCGMSKQQINYHTLSPRLIISDGETKKKPRRTSHRSFTQTSNRKKMLVRIEWNKKSPMIELTCFKNIMQLKIVPVQIRSLTSIHNFIAMFSPTHLLSHSRTTGHLVHFKQNLYAVFVAFFIHSKNATRVDVLQVLSIWSTHK